MKNLLLVRPALAAVSSLSEVEPDEDDDEDAADPSKMFSTSSLDWFDNIRFSDIGKTVGEEAPCLVGPRIASVGLLLGDIGIGADAMSILF